MLALKANLSKPGEKKVQTAASKIQPSVSLGCGKPSLTRTYVNHRYGEGIRQGTMGVVRWEMTATGSVKSRNESQKWGTGKFIRRKK